MFTFSLGVEQRSYEIFQKNYESLGNYCTIMLFGAIMFFGWTRHIILADQSDHATWSKWSCYLISMDTSLYSAEKAERLRKEEAMRTPLPHLLGYLADGRYLTVEELDRIQDHIRDRKNRLLASKGLPPEPSHGESWSRFVSLSRLTFFASSC